VRGIVLELTNELGGKGIPKERKSGIGELFLGWRRMRKKVVVGMTIRRKMKGGTIQEKENKVMTNRDKWAAEINYFAHRLYRAMIWFLVYISHTDMRVLVFVCVYCVGAFIRNTK
jgi:hypothetical protein